MHSSAHKCSQAKWLECKLTFHHITVCGLETIKHHRSDNLASPRYGERKQWVNCNGRWLHLRRRRRGRGRGRCSWDERQKCISHIKLSFLIYYTRWLAVYIHFLLFVSPKRHTFESYRLSDGCTYGRLANCRWRQQRRRRGDGGELMNASSHSSTETFLRLYSHFTANNKWTGYCKRPSEYASVYQQIALHRVNGKMKRKLKNECKANTLNCDVIFVNSFISLSLGSRRLRHPTWAPLSGPDQPDNIIISLVFIISIIAEWAVLNEWMSEWGSHLLLWGPRARYVMKLKELIEARSNSFCAF